MKRAEKYFQNAYAKLEKKKAQEAIKRFNKAIALDPTFADAYVGRGIAKFAKGDLEGSIADYEIARTFTPDAVANNRTVAQTYVIRGEMEFEDLQLENAIRDFSRAIEAFPNDGEFYLKRGQAYLVLSNYAAAIADFNQSLLLSTPDTSIRALVYGHRGYTFLLQKRDCESMKDGRELLRFSSGIRMLVELHLRTIDVKRRQVQIGHLQLHKNRA